MTSIEGTCKGSGTAAKGIQVTCPKCKELVAVQYNAILPHVPPSKNPDGSNKR